MGISYGFRSSLDALRGRCSHVKQVRFAFRSLVSPPVPNHWPFIIVLAPFMGLLLPSCSYEARGSPVAGMVLPWHKPRGFDRINC